MAPKVNIGESTNIAKEATPRDLPIEYPMKIQINKTMR